MPDLVTHVGLAYGIRRMAPVPGLNAWFLLGAVLPDVLTRSVTLIWPAASWFVMPIHTPVGAALVALLIGATVDGARRGRVALNLFAGASLHLLLDLAQRHVAGGYYLLFPFSWQQLELGLVWPETSLYLLPLWAVLALCMLVSRRPSTGSVDQPI